MITYSIQRYLVAVAVLLVGVMTFGAMALAGHNGAVVSEDVNSCEPTTISATITDPDAGHVTANMRLVVDTDAGAAQNALIPTDGSAAEISVGPFGTDTTVYWRVFGGGERDYDLPAWNGYGGPTFGADVGAYGAENGYGFVVAGTDDGNPFVTWNEVEVPACAPEVKVDCKNGGWEAFGFKNQGQCVRFVETGKDSR